MASVAPLPDLRIGNGIDFHRLIEDCERPLRIGGVTIDSELALKGHSDADLLLHSIADALLGALGLGDIGHFFPDSSSDCKDLDSAEILRHAAREVERAGFTILSVDSTIIGERPKLAPYREMIRSSIASILQIDQSRVGCKATTSEKMGALGRSEGLGSLSTVLIGRAT